MVRPTLTFGAGADATPPPSSVTMTTSAAAHRLIGPSSFGKLLIRRRRRVSRLAPVPDRGVELSFGPPRRSSMDQPSGRRRFLKSVIAMGAVGLPAPGQADEAHRSEEHTSELQSPCNLVCRLLLEKKKENTQN